MDTIFSDTPVVNGGQTAAQIFVGCYTKLVSIHPLHDTGEDEILGEFQDCVWWHGAYDELTGDNASVYNGSKFIKYVRDLYIQLWKSESYHQHQNYSENVWGSIKYGNNCLLDYLGAARNLFLAGLVYYAFIWNHTVNPDIADSTCSLYTLTTGYSDDISPLLCFKFNEPVYCSVYQEEKKFPLELKEICGHWIGISKHVSAPMTWKILTNKTQKIICRSEICSALNSKSRNLSVDSISSTNFHMLLSHPPIDDLVYSPSAIPVDPPHPWLDPAKVFFLLQSWGA